jgi:hypothetical protein
MTRNLPIHAAPCLLALLFACEAQVSPEYRGEALLTIAGSVEIDRDRDRGTLMPALAFHNSESSDLRIMDVDVEGEFPSDFTLPVDEPPRPSARSCCFHGASACC